MNTTDIETESVPTFDVPMGVLEVLRPYARQDGHQLAKSSTARWAVIELAKRIREEQSATEKDSR